jgi:hypothetical protein
MLRIVTAFAFAALLAGPAAAADYWIDNAAYPGLPACDSPGVVARVVGKAAHPSLMAWNEPVYVEHIDGVRQTGLKAGGPGLIDRRYCHARVWLSNGRRSQAVYVIEAGQGFAGIGWHVESCLTGYDPYKVYDGWCNAIRP